MVVDVADQDRLEVQQERVIMLGLEDIERLQVQREGWVVLTKACIDIGHQRT